MQPLGEKMIGTDDLFMEYQDNVKPEWIDMNGHMNVAYYVLVFDLASDVFLQNFGLGESYIKEENASVFIVEMNVSYFQELHVDAPLLFKTQLLGVDEKKLHVFHYMYHATEGYLAATNEILFIHVDLKTRRSKTFSTDIYKKMAAMEKGACSRFATGKCRQTIFH